MTNAESLPELLRKKDHKTISDLVHLHTKVLLRGALAMGFDKNVGQELVQQTWATFFQIVDKFEGKSHVRTYLFGILYNKALEHRRIEKRFDRRDVIEDVLDKRFDERGHWIRPPANPEEMLLKSENLRIIQECLEALPLQQRTAFVLREVEEKETREICNILELTVTNLGVVMYRARNRLRECIEKKSVAT